MQSAEAEVIVCEGPLTTDYPFKLRAIKLVICYLSAELSFLLWSKNCVLVWYTMSMLWDCGAI